MRKLGSALAAGALVALAAGTAAAQDKIKIGYAVSKTGPNAPGAGITTIPNYKLWLSDIEKAGGIKLGDKMVPVEVIEYDDQSSTEELVRAVERLINQDKVDIVLSPWGTGMNLAVGATLNKYGYPHLAATAATDKAYEMAERWPNSFWMLGTSTMGANALVEVLSKLKADGKINNKIAMVSVADAFGIELSTAARPALEKAGFELALDESYPITTQDFSQLINSAKSSGADTFVAFSYPPDTFGLTGAAIASGYNPPAFYTAVGTAFPIYKQKLFGDNVDGVLGVGGVNPDDPKFQEYLQAPPRSDRPGARPLGEPGDLCQPANAAAGDRARRQDRPCGDHQGACRPARSTPSPARSSSTATSTPMSGGPGQWQNGEFYGLAPTSMAGAKQPIAPKPAWKPAK